MKASQTFRRGTSQNPTKHPSLLARCTAPFASKQRNALEQDIQLDEPFRQYYSGDTVKGAVHMNVTKSQRITHLVIRLHGFVKVANRAKLPGESISYDEALMALEKGRGRRGIEYFGNGFARLFEDETVLCGEGRVIGQYEFRFEMVLPSKGLPSGIDVSDNVLPNLHLLNESSLICKRAIVRTRHHILPTHLDSDAPNNHRANLIATPKAWLPGSR